MRWEPSARQESKGENAVNIYLKFVAAAVVDTRRLYLYGLHQRKPPFLDY